MMELFSEKTPAETLAQFKGQGLSPRQTKKVLKNLEKHFLTAKLSSIQNFQLFSVVTSAGDHYDEIEFAVTSRFKRNGDTFLAGEQFCVNFSKLIRDSPALEGW